MAQRYNRPDREAVLHFLTINIRDRQPIFAYDAYARIALRILREHCDSYPAKLIAYVAMPEHLHCIINPRDGQCIRFLQHYKPAVPPPLTQLPPARYTSSARITSIRLCCECIMFFRQKPASGLAADLKLVVGLGNIGQPYQHTRHNIGFEVADELARRGNARFRTGKFKGEDATIHLGGQRVLLLKPHTLMNLSGDAVVAAARFYKLPPTQILVICDDVNLPVGKLRLRANGSDGGHNGLWNITNRLGSKEFPRLRIGVGQKPPEMDLAAYVLGRFLADERPAMDAARDDAAQAVETWVREGIEAAMNRWNAARP
ncbi:MAG TPA: aminoacyl-tRNA hydrolase [Armatimonadota bacterium]|jgi:PTH1 family peptidyl-tRNA hydrolase